MSYDISDAVITFENGNRIEILEEYAAYAAARRREVERQTLAATFNRTSSESRDAIQLLAREYGVSFIDSLNSVWASMDDGFELADEEEYVVTDPISFDELMGVTE